MTHSPSSRARSWPTQAWMPLPKPTLSSNSCCAASPRLAWTVQKRFGAKLRYTGRREASRIGSGQLIGPARLAAERHRWTRVALAAVQHTGGPGIECLPALLGELMALVDCSRSCQRARLMGQQLVGHDDVVSHARKPTHTGPPKVVQHPTGHGDRLTRCEALLGNRPFNSALNPAECGQLPPHGRAEHQITGRATRDRAQDVYRRCR